MWSNFSSSDELEYTGIKFTNFSSYSLPIIQSLTMGVEYSVPAARHPEVPFCIISFFYDQVQICNADDDVISIVRNNLVRNYKGIQKESRKDDVYLFKCKGYPFSTNYSTDHQMFIKCMCFLLKDMCEAGYIKVFSGDFNWYIDLSAWFFYKSPGAVAKDIEFCAVDLWSWDKLKLFNCENQICEAIKYTVHENWRGIQKAEQDELSYQLKLKGYPWSRSSGDDAVKNRMLIMKILQTMASYGWTLYSATNIDNFTDTLFFCRKRNLYISHEFCSSILAISLNQNDRLRLINADGGVIEAIKTVIRGNWSEIQKEGDYHGSYEFKLKGTPWWVRGEKSLPSVSLLCAIFVQLRRMGWKAIMNLDISRSDHDKGVFFFIRMPPKESYYCALSLKDSGYIYGVHLHEKIQATLTQVFTPYFELRPSSKTPAMNYAIKWTIMACPWSSSGTSTMRFNGQLLMAAMVNAMVGFNYHLCSSADISSKSALNVFDIRLDKDIPCSFIIRFVIVFLGS